MEIKPLVIHFCSSCKKEVPIFSSHTSFYICPFCAQVYKKIGKDIAASPKYAKRPVTITPLKIGTTFTFDGIDYRIIGRVVLAFEERICQLWSTINSKGDQYWLLQFNNQFILGTYFTTDKDVVLQLEMRVGMRGTSVPGLDKNYILNVISRFKFALYEGETDWIGSNDGNGLLYVFQTKEGKYYFLLVNNEKDIKAIAGLSIPFNGFKFKHLNELALWE